MKTITLAVLALATAFTGFAQQSNTSNTNENVRLAYEAYVSVADEYALKVQRIHDLSRTMHQSDNPESVKIEIENLQRELLALRDKAIIDRRNSVASKKAEMVTIYEFDETKRTLRLKDFDYNFEPVSAQLNVKFDTRAMGNAHVVLVTPGKVMLQNEALNNFNGSYEGHFDLSKDALLEYYLHIEIDGKVTTKKIQIG